MARDAEAIRFYKETWKNALWKNYSMACIVCGTRTFVGLDVLHIVDSGPPMVLPNVNENIPPLIYHFVVNL